MSVPPCIPCTEDRMATPRSPIRITLSPDEHAQLQHLMRSTTAPNGLVQRARMVVLFAEGIPIIEVARRVAVQRRIVKKWLRRFAARRLDGLEDAPRPGRPPVFSPRCRAPRREDRV